MIKYDFANITVRPFLKLSDVNNPYIFGETKHVIDMCYYREPEVIDLIQSKGATFDWLPTSARLIRCWGTKRDVCGIIWDVGRVHVSRCGFCHLAMTVALLACRFAALLYVAVARNRF